MSVYKKLLQVQMENSGVKKDGKNPFTKSNYITLDNIVDTLSPIRSKHGLVVYHRTQDGYVITSVHDTEAQGTEEKEVTSTFKLIESNDPQKLGSCITYAKRYNLGQLFNIVTDKDDDGEKAKPLTGNTTPTESVSSSTWTSTKPPQVTSVNYNSL